MIILELGMSNSESILQLLGVSILFVFILVITYYTTKFVGGVKLGQTKKGNFKVLETYKIAQNKYLQLVQIGTRYFVIAIGKDDICSLVELQESEIIQQEQFNKQNIKFIDVLTKLHNKQTDKNKNDDQEIDHK